VRIARIEVGQVIALVNKPRSVKEKSVCVEIYYQLGDYNIWDLTFVDLLEQMLREPFFDDLRTRQQVVCLCDT
jgi:secreted Zn-dependent insulinase-like peptidase